jgi:hypothetical protein
MNYNKRKKKSKTYKKSTSAAYDRGTRKIIHPKIKKHIVPPSNGFQKMNCSPFVKGKTPVKESCFTGDILEKLKETYNRTHPENPISETDHKGIWNTLRERMTHCQKEDCWLDALKADPKMHAMIDDIIFAPYRPSEWKKKKNTWLSNFNIDDVLEQYEETYPQFQLFGSSPINFNDRPAEYKGKCVWDDLCNFSLQKQVETGKTKMGFVFNLDEHDEDGSHWVSMFIDLEDKFIFYMDSAGDRMPSRIRQFVDKVISQGQQMNPPIRFICKSNHPTRHQLGASECGMYSLFFIITLLTGKAGDIELRTAKEKFDFFKKQRIPDSLMLEYREVYFN